MNVMDTHQYNSPPNISQTYLSYKGAVCIGKLALVYSNSKLDYHRLQHGTITPQTNLIYQHQWRCSTHKLVSFFHNINNQKLGISLTSHAFLCSCCCYLTLFWKRMLVQNPQQSQSDSSMCQPSRWLASHRGSYLAISLEKVKLKTVWAPPWLRLPRLVYLLGF